jgi:putative Holliday junction resolvase
MRILGIDYGTKRIGLALSDELGYTAQPLQYVEAEKFAQIGEIVRQREVTKIVVGLPRNMDGTYGPSAEAAKALIEKLKLLVSVPIVTWDERLTTSQANRIMIETNTSRAKRKEKVDSMAAQLLLQSYLDAHATP